MLAQSERLTEVLELCLERLHNGEDPAQCLRDYPEYAGELEPMLIVAAQARDLPMPSLSPKARNAIRRQLRDTVAGRQPARRTAPRSWFGAPLLRLAMALVVALLALGSGAVAAAQRSLPGDPLYRLKRASEAIELSLATTPERRAALYLNAAETRADELRLLLANGRAIDVQIVEDIAATHELAWNEIERLAGPREQELQAWYVRAIQEQITVLSAAQAHISAAHQPALSEALRNSEQALSRVVATPAPGAPPAPASNGNQPDAPRGDQGQPPGEPSPGGQAQPGGNTPGESGQPGAQPGQSQPEEPADDLPGNSEQGVPHSDDQGAHQPPAQPGANPGQGNHPEQPDSGEHGQSGEHAPDQEQRHDQSENNKPDKSDTSDKANRDENNGKP